MKKNTILKVVSIVLALATIVAIVCAVTVTGSGFLDLSNIVRVVCISVSMVFGILVAVVWKCSKQKD